MTDDKKKKEFYDLLDRFFDLDKRSDELKLFVAGHALNVNSWFNRRASANDLKRTLDPWLERFVQWEDHINAYHELEGGRYGTKRIDKLSKHLDVLDTKIGIALNFNSLLVAGVSLFAPWITNFGLSLCSSGRWVFEIFVVLVFVVLGLLVWNLGILLRGFRRVVWGRLGASTSNSQEQNSEKEAEGKTETAEEGNKKAEKDEEDYVRFLIMSVARRTNCFRISTYITKVVRWSIALLLLMGAAVVVEHYRCHETIAGNAPSSVSTPGEGSVSITITGGDVQFGRVQSLNPKPFEPKSPDIGMPKLDPKLEAAFWQHVQSPPVPPTPTNTPRWIILFFIVSAVAVLIAVIWLSLKRKPEATPLTVAIATLAAVSTAIEKFAGKGQIPPVGTVPLLVIIVASALILVGVALFGAGLRWFFSLRPESHPDAIRNGSLLGAALLVFGFSATLLALVPPLVFRADVASPRPCPKCPMVEAMKAEKIEAFPLDEIDDLGDGSRPEDKVIEPRKLQKLKGDLREKSAKAGDILLLLGSADCVATKKGGLWRNNEDLAKARADWVNHSLGGQEEVKDIKIKSLPLPQHARCGPARNVRAVFPFLIHPENN